MTYRNNPIINSFKQISETGNREASSWYEMHCLCALTSCITIHDIR